MPQMTALVGLPGSGKSTWIKNNTSQEIIIAIDDYFQRDPEGYRSWTDNNGQLCRWYYNLIADDTFQKAWVYVWDTFAQSLQSQSDIVIEHVFPNYHSRLPFARISKQFGYSTRAVFLDVPKELCIERNNSRRDKVPIKVIDNMYNIFSPPIPSEGWDEIILISW